MRALDHDLSMGTQIATATDAQTLAKRDQPGSRNGADVLLAVGDLNSAKPAYPLTELSRRQRRIAPQIVVIVTIAPISAP